MVNGYFGILNIFEGAENILGSVERKTRL